MTRALAPVPILLLALGCEPESTADRISITVGGGDPVVRMDLEPITLAADVDNNVDVIIDFAGEDNSTSEPASVIFEQYRIDYGFGEDCAGQGRADGTGDCAPYISGPIFVEVFEGSSEQLSLRGAVEEQLDWVWARYPGDEFDVPARVSLSGAYDEREGVTVSAEYTATFADYR